MCFTSINISVACAIALLSYSFWLMNRPCLLTIMYNRQAKVDNTDEYCLLQAYLSVL
jgi:hypothetical protein